MLARRLAVQHQGEYGGWRFTNLPPHSAWLEHWVCKVESTGHLFLIAESALDELLSEPADDVHETS